MHLTWLLRRSRIRGRHVCRLRRAAPTLPALGDDEAAGPQEPGSACGWFDSSWELRRGLQVIEHTGFERLPPEVPLAWLLA